MYAHTINIIAARCTSQSVFFILCKTEYEKEEKEKTYNLHLSTISESYFNYFPQYILTVLYVTLNSYNL